MSESGWLSQDLSPDDTLKALYEFTDAVYHARTADEIYASALDAITLTLRCERASILLFDGDGIMQFVAWRGLSDRYRERLAGHTPWTPADEDPPPIFVPDIRETNEPDWIKDEISSEGIVSLGFVPLTLEGRVIGKFMTYYAQRQDFESRSISLAVTIARQLGFSIGRARAEASREAALLEVQRSEARFRQMTEEAPVMIWMSNPQGHCEQLNRLARDFWGVAEDGLDQFDWAGTIHPEDSASVLAQMGQAIAGAHPVNVRGRYRNREGDWRLLQTEARPRYSADGSFLGMIGVNVDITEQETISRQRELMLAELNHRVKNTLAVVQAIAQQTFKADRDLATVATFLGRLRVLARAHDILSGVRWESTPLQDLVRDVLAGVPSSRGTIMIDGPAFLLPPKQALAVALALHELQTNALKYGALSVEGGTVSLAWKPDAEGRLEILWQERGGPPVAQPARRGFGTLMLEQGLVTELNGAAKLDFQPGGLVCRIEAACEGTRL
ncbi:sensor histidine kinase [Tabrizicola aquatica]|uniref:sensor histidine kinase n=1 Tax=Tabrizicola aquatica TaxID=909926 RepID=UPI000CD23441|nr:HWE histidine kinase domain-containing protein [Tabrizicola aquatica]